jgi:hypothetical protein
MVKVFRSLLSVFWKSLRLWNLMIQLWVHKITQTFWSNFTRLTSSHPIPLRFILQFTLSFSSCSFRLTFNDAFFIPPPWFLRPHLYLFDSYVVKRRRIQTVKFLIKWFSAIWSTWTLAMSNTLFWAIINRRSPATNLQMISSDLPPLNCCYTRKSNSTLISVD